MQYMKYELLFLESIHYPIHSFVVISAHQIVSRYYFWDMISLTDGIFMSCIQYLMNSNYYEVGCRILDTFNVVQLLLLT